MRIRDLPIHERIPLSCTRVIIIKCSDYEGNILYRFTGTGFFIEFKGKIYFITANHCVVSAANGKRVPIADLIIFVDFISTDRRENVEFDLCYKPCSNDGDNTDQNDLVIYRVNMNEIPIEVVKAISPFNFEQPVSSVLYQGIPVAIVGYPFEMREINYEEKRICTKIWVTHGAILKADSSQRNVFIVKYRCDSEIINADGMSGSPVFAIHPSGMQLIGLVIRGGTGRECMGFKHYSTLRVIDASVLVEALFRLETTYRN